LEDPPEADLSATSVLVLNGREDPFARNAPQLADAIDARGARVNFRELSAGHELAVVDVTETSRWIGEIYR
jgi:phospholipase/carboxylesterase